jgi:hypothetical protein
VDLDGDGMAVDAKQGGGRDETEHAALLGSQDGEESRSSAGLEALRAS